MFFEICWWMLFHLYTFTLCKYQCFLSIYVMYYFVLFTCLFHLGCFWVCWLLHGCRVLAWMLIALGCWLDTFMVRSWCGTWRRARFCGRLPMYIRRAYLSFEFGTQKTVHSQSAMTAPAPSFCWNLNVWSVFVPAIFSAFSLAAEERCI